MPYKPTGKPPGRPKRVDPASGSTTESVKQMTETAETKLDVTETPEFKAAIEKERSLFRAEMDAFKSAALDEFRKASGQSPNVDMASVISTLALEIGKVSDQGTDRKRVAPEELVAREKAWNAMGDLLTAAQAKPQKEWPRYKLIAKIQMLDRVIDPQQRLDDNSYGDTEILHCGIPNTAMRPINEAAKEIFRHFVRALGGSKEANQVAPVQPTWTTAKGTVIVGASPATIKAHGHERMGEPIVIDDDASMEADIARSFPGGRPPQSIISTTDKNATRIPVLGSIAEPATVGTMTPKAA